MAVTLRSRQLHLLSLVLGGSLCWGHNAFAFKTGTHAAAANQVVEELSASLDATGGVLEFEINGRRLDVSVSAADAYNAVRAFPDFFAAGTIGPDGFPDPLTGQILMHGDGSEVVKNLVEEMTGTRPADHDGHTEKFSDRTGPAEYRSIDFATSMLKFFATYTPVDESERQQIIAFIMGYVSHGVGDSFAHTWVNEIAGGAWDLSLGGGLWGTFSEEVKHIAIETMVDKLVPSELKSLPGDHGGLERIRFRAPTRFLDEFYAAQSFNSPVAPYTAGDSLGEFITHYRNFNVYNGGFFYNYLNAQTNVAETLKQWSGFGRVFDVAEAANNNAFVRFGLDTVQLPETVGQWLSAGPNPLGWIDELTGGFVDCHAEHFGSPLPTPIADLREALEFVGGINGRIANYTHKTEVIRRNWIKLSQCTAENMARSGAADFDPAEPSFNRDSCADLVREGWEDESADGASGLYRGDIRPRANVGNVIFPDLNNDEVFLLELKAAFLGGNAAALFGLVDDPLNQHSVWEQAIALEGKNEHRSLGENLNRQFDYLVGFAFRGDELDEVVFPDDGGQIKDSYNDLCSAARDEGFERCLDLAFAPLAAAGRETMCLAEHAVCTANSVKQCLQNACENTCILPFGACGDICGTGQTSSCKSTCNDVLCPFPPFLCEPVATVTCRSVCDIFNDEDRQDSCYDAALDEAICGVEHIKCSFDNFVDTITLDNYAEELLTPARQACDTIDDALELIECLAGDPSQPKEVQAAARRDCVVALCASQSSYSPTDCAEMYDRLEDVYEDAERVKDALTVLADALSDRPPHEIVNVAFLLEDLRRSSEYRDAVRGSIASTRTAWQNNPPGPGASADEMALYARRGDAINRWDQLLNDIAAFPSPSDPIDEFADISTDAAQLITDSNELGLIPSVIGPTAQDIYRDIGPEFEQTFIPYYNTRQGMKLVPLQSPDLSTVFSAEAPDSLSLLPSARALAGESQTSPECGAPGAVLYCDTLLSFDDPNCLNCDGPSLQPNPGRNDWVPGRSIVAFNNYDPSDPVRHVSTVFPFSSSDQSYDSLYTRIFRVPSSVPDFAGFDDPEHPWTSDQTDLTINTDNTTEGSGSLQVEGCNWMRLDSPRFSTVDWGVVGDQLKVDVFIPADQVNPYWIGDTQVFVTVPKANVYNQPLSWRGLTDLSRPGWSTLSYDVPTYIQDALLGDYANAQISIQVNYSGCTAPILFDNLRFDGNLREREIFHLLGSSLLDVQSNDLFGFDHESDWSSSSFLSSQGLSVEGAASLGVQAAGFQSIRSRAFSTSEIPGVTANLTLDLYLPRPQPNIHWNGDVALSLSCSNLSGSYIGPPVPLTHLFEDEFNTLAFTLNSDQVTALTSGASGCWIEVLLNTNAAGMVLLDNMGFH